jgi:serine protease Do
VKVGDYSLALGNPFGYAKDSTPTVTMGVVSAIHRNQGAYSDAIQTDAPINPGNSGGPLIDKQGRLIGINGRIAVRNGVKINTGVGYAIPANQIVRFMESFKKDGVVHHGYVSGLRVSSPREGSGGAIVGEVSKDAEAAGFKKGDVIIEADGRPVPHASRFHGIVGTIPAGEKIRVKVRRGEEHVELEIALTKQGGGDAANSDGPPPNPNGTYLGLRMKASDTGMVEVEEVVEGSPAAEAGLKPGDLISHFGRRKVTNVNEMIQQIVRRKPGDKVTLAVTRDGHKIEVHVTLGKRAEK